MHNVEGIIGQLLFRHNCVIIPSFGGFVAKPVSAKIDFDNGIMYPPSKSLLFNRQLVNNDGLLINEYAEANGRSFDQAATEIQEVINHWKSKLKKGERIEIDKVGNLFLDIENNICFEQDRFYNLLLESFGLSQVQFLSEEDVQIVESTIEIIEKREEEVERHNQTEKSVKIIPIVAQENEEELLLQSSTVEKKKKSNSVWRYVAAACLLPIAFYSFWIPLTTDVLESGVISIKDFNPFYQTPTPSYSRISPLETSTNTITHQLDLEAKIDELPDGATEYPMKYSENHFITVDLPQSENADYHANTEKTRDKEETLNELISPNAIHYIVGAFGNKSNAQKLIKKLQSKGLEAKIVGYTNGLHRVASGSALSEEALQDIIIKSKKVGYPGSILR